MSKIVVLLVIAILVSGVLYYVFTYYRNVLEVKPIYELVSIYSLNYDLEEYVGRKITVAGYFGYGGYFGCGNASFLIVDYNRLILDEPLPFGSWIRIDGVLPSNNYDGSLIQVCGVVRGYTDKYSVFSLYNIPLVEVEEYRVVGEEGEGQVFLENPTGEYHHALLDSAYIKPNLIGSVKSCDRALIISGGIDEHNNHPRYRSNIVEKYRKLRSFGFNDDMITVLYYDGGEIKVDGRNIVDGNASRSSIDSIVKKYLKDMNPCCTLYIFITDHGFGYDPNQGDGWEEYKITKVIGTPNPLDPSYGDPGNQYREDKIVIDARDLKYKYRVDNFPTGRWCIIHVEKTGKIYAWKLNLTNSKWELIGIGSDKDGNGKISELELGNINMDNNPSSNYEIDLSSLTSTHHSMRENDLDGDGQIDFRVEWNNGKFIARRRDSSGNWHVVGEDTDSDNIIVGVDLDIDGQKVSQYTFHESICLYGREKLWDYEFARMLKPLHDRGIHILVEMGQCFSGGFIENLNGIVDKIVTAAREDRKAYATKDKWSDFEHFFIKNLNELSVEGWNKATINALKELIPYQVEKHGRYLDSPQIGEAPKKPDLVVEISLFYTTNKVCVDTIPLITVIRNIGWDSIQNPKVNIYINNKLQVEKTVNTILKPGEFETLEFKCVFREPGNYKLKAIVDPDNRVNEVFEDNNEAEYEYEVSAPDLKIENIMFTPDRIQACTTVKIKVNITNIGYCPAHNFKVELEILRPGKEPATPIYVGILEFQFLDVGRSLIAEFNYHFKEAGEYVVRATVDPEDEIIELDKNNNFKDARLEVLPVEKLPDLGVKLTVPVEDLYNGTLYSFNVVIYNHGEFEVSTIVLLEISDGRIYESEAITIPANSSINTKFLIDFPTSGFYTLKATVDPYDMVHELNEGNNEYILQVNVLNRPLPDLIVEYLKVYYTIYFRNEYQYVVIDKIDFTTSNIGFGNYSGTISIHVWIDSPRNVVVEYVISNGLRSMEISNHTLLLNYQATYSSHIVGIVIDPLNSIVEENEDNNTLTIEIKLQE
ncbi:MAG: CARDB domain-containing protein [Candidatus Methanomethylicia archaeon]